MPALVEYSAACLEHIAGPGHPERRRRLTAVVDGIRALQSDVTWVEPRRATIDELALVHNPRYIDALGRFCQEGGGMITLDTGASAGSWEAALRAAGSGLDAVERGRSQRSGHAGQPQRSGHEGQPQRSGHAGQPQRSGHAGRPSFCAVRPPGHHAISRAAQGFCLFNNIAVCAASLAAAGERVLIVDWDAHHGNGTQDTFYEDDRVLYVSMHQWPLYPFTGRIDEMGEGARATT